MFNDALPVCGVRKLEPENLGVLFSLLETVSRRSVDRLGLDYRDRKIPTVPQEIVGALLRASRRPLAGDDDPAIREALLLTDLRVFPAGAIELRQHIGAASVSFIEGHGSFIPGRLC